MRHRICIQSKYNAFPSLPFLSLTYLPLLSHLPLSLFLSFSLLSPFSSATKEGFVARRSSTKPYTHPLHRHRRLAELLERYKRVRARAIRQRCNVVLRAPLSSPRISCFVDLVSSIRPRCATRKARKTTLQGERTSGSQPLFAPLATLIANTWIQFHIKRKI